MENAQNYSLEFGYFLCIMLSMEKKRFADGVLTTLCYAEKDGKWLMLHRNKKKEDINKGKWIGVGGHFEEGESPEDCLYREVFEETGLHVLNHQLRGIVSFFFGEKDCSYMFLYTASLEEGKLKECLEGELQYFSYEEILRLPLWEGDRIFLDLLAKGQGFFSLTLRYDREGKLLEAILDGRERLLPN